MKIEDIKIIAIPKITAEDGRGSLSIIEGDVLPFPIKRVYYLYDVPSGSTRGGHAHKELQQCLISLSGSFVVVIEDATQRKEILLNRPDQGLLIPNGLWRELIDFSAGAVCLSLVSASYDESDYIRSYEEFVEYKKSLKQSQ